jgi:hypothetical protein
MCSCLNFVCFLRLNQIPAVEDVFELKATLKNHFVFTAERLFYCLFYLMGRISPFLEFYLFRIKIGLKSNSAVL